MKLAISGLILVLMHLQCSGWFYFLFFTETSQLNVTFYFINSVNQYNGFVY